MDTDRCRYRGGSALNQIESKYTESKNKTQELLRLMQAKIPLKSFYKQYILE